MQRYCPIRPITIFQLCHMTTIQPITKKFRPCLTIVQPRAVGTTHIVEIYRPSKRFETQLLTHPLIFTSSSQKFSHTRTAFCSDAVDRYLFSGAAGSRELGRELDLRGKELRSILRYMSRDSKSRDLDRPRDLLNSVDWMREGSREPGGGRPVSSSTWGEGGLLGQNILDICHL